MPSYTQGITSGYSSVNAGVIPPDVYGIANEWFVNRTPLLTRLPKAPVGSMSFKLTNDKYRPNTAVLTTAIAADDTTSFEVDDASMFDVGDVIQVGSEYSLVTAINTGTNVLTVTRGHAGTTAASSHADNSVVYLITNTRTGAEVDINAISRIPAVTEQYLQTIQHAYQVGGSLASATNYTSGYGTPLQRDKFMAVQHCMDDAERAMYYGKGVALTSGGRPAMSGLKALLTTNTTSSPTNASSYGPDDLIRDTVQKCFDNGGLPSVMVVSTNFLTGLSIWGHNAQQLDAGTNVFGTPIQLFAVSFLPGIVFVPAPHLRAGTAICLSGTEARVRVKRDLAEKPRGSRGDAEEGDFIMEVAIEVENEHHHAWVDGITTFVA